MCANIPIDFFNKFVAYTFWFCCYIFLRFHTLLGFFFLLFSLLFYFSSLLSVRIRLCLYNFSVDHWCICKYIYIKLYVPCKTRNDLKHWIERKNKNRTANERENHVQNNWCGLAEYFIHKHTYREREREYCTSKLRFAFARRLNEGYWQSGREMLMNCLEIEECSTGQWQ